MVGGREGGREGGEGGREEGGGGGGGEQLGFSLIECGGAVLQLWGKLH